MLIFNVLYIIIKVQNKTNKKRKVLCIMKKFNNVNELNEFLMNEFDFGLEEGFEDFEKFVGENEFEMIFDEDEDMILVLNEKKYYVVENIMGIKFVEV